MNTFLSYNNDTERFSASQLVSLSSAKTLKDIENAADKLCHFFDISFFDIYCFSPEKKYYKKALSATKKTNRFTHTEVEINKELIENKPPNKIRFDSDLYKEIHAATAKRFENFKTNSLLETSSRFSTISYNGRKIGFIVAKSEKENILTKNKQYIIQLSTAYLKSIARIEKNKKNIDLTKTTHQLFESSNEAFCRWTTEKGWSFLNPHLLHRIGYDQLDFQIINIFGNKDCMDSSTWLQCEKSLKKCIASGKNATLEYAIIAPNGKTHIFQSKLVVQKKSTNGEATEITGISTDISNSKKISQQAIANINMDTWLLQLNSKLFSRSDKEAISKNLKEIGEHLDFDRALIRLYEEDGTASVYTEWTKANMMSMREIAPSISIPQPLSPSRHTFENLDSPNLSGPQKSIARKGGYQSQIFSPMYNNGKCIGYFVLQNKEPSNFSELLIRCTNIIADTFSMVVEKQKILERLESSKERFQLAMEAASYGLWELNLATNTIFLNSTYHLMLGYDADANPNVHELNLINIHIDDREKTLQFIEDLKLNKSDNLSYESRHISISGEVLWILTRGKVIKWDDTGKPLLATGTLTNISHLKKSQMNLQLAYQEAQSARIAKGEFLARMSHEIRTPMNAIIGMSYLALQTDLSETQHQYITDIDNAAKALLQIIDDILDFSKIEAGKLIIDPHPINIIKHMERISSRYQPLAAEKKLSLEILIDHTIPEIIITDSTRLRQILDKLIGNAIKFTDVGSVRIAIKKIVHEKHQEISFLVSDTGIGLEPSQLDTLFEPFNQADGSSTRLFGGTGIGLSISRHLVELMGGRIKASGEKGKGSQFQFSIPCEALNEPATENLANSTQINTTLKSIKQAGVVAPNATASSTSHHLNVTPNHLNQITGTPSKPDSLKDRFKELQRKHVLLVEDNKVNQKVAAGTLKHQDMHVTIANNGTEAVYIMKASAKDKFDFILMDIEMPYMGGFEATAAIRAIERHTTIPIIAMTANIVGDKKGAYLQAGMNDCISKPIGPEALYQVLQQQLDSPKTHI
ncbi:MAG: response regulator [Cellvibrionaceae bacterium]